MNINTLHKNKKLKLKLSLFTLLISFLVCYFLLTLIYKHIKTNSELIINSTDTLVSSESIVSSTSSSRFITDSKQYELTQASQALTLSIDEINYYSSLSYNERLNFLFNNSYSLKDRIEVFLSTDIHNVGLIYYNLKSNEEISINSDSIFTAASTYKVGLNLLTYYLASIGEINLDDEISYIYDDYEEGTGVLYLQDYIGTYTIQELLDLSIIYSDNIATNMVGRYLGGHTAVRSALYDLLDIEFITSENLITPNIELKILQYIYNNRYLSGFSHLINTLTQTDFSDRLDKYIPSNIVAHKVGTIDTNIHDVGIILTDEPYILEIYTYDLHDAEEKIAQISKAIYESY